MVYIISYRRNEDHLSHCHFKIKVSSFDALKTLTSENSKHAYFLRPKNYNIEELKRKFTEENSEVIGGKIKVLTHQHTSKLVDIVMCLHFKNQTNSSRNSEELQEIVTCKSYFHRKIERGKIRIGKKKSFMTGIEKKKLALESDVCTYYIPNFHRKAVRTRKAMSKKERWGESKYNCIAFQQAAHSFFFNFFCKTTTFNKYNYLKKYNFYLKDLYFKKIKFIRGSKGTPLTSELPAQPTICLNISTKGKKADSIAKEVENTNSIKTIMLTAELSNLLNSCLKERESIRNKVRLVFFKTCKQAYEMD